MPDLMLLENPARRKRSRMYDFDFGNPIPNPRRHHRRSRRNPIGDIGSKAKDLFLGVGINDILGGLIGFSAATLIPRQVLPIPAGELAPAKETRQWSTIGVSVLCAVGAGFLVKMVFPDAAKSAVIGGMAGAGGMIVNKVMAPNTQYFNKTGEPQGFLPNPMAAPALHAPMAMPIGAPSRGIGGTGNARQFSDVLME
jgi:hypothetical protein